MQVGATTSAGYNYAGQPVYYVDLQWVQTAYIWGWAQVESQVAFLGSNPTSGWGGVVMDSTVSQNNNAGSPTDYASFFAGNIDAQSAVQLKNESILGGEVKLTGADNDLTINGQRRNIRLIREVEGKKLISTSS